MALNTVNAAQGQRFYADYVERLLRRQEACVTVPEAFTTEQQGALLVHLNERLETPISASTLNLIWEQSIHVLRHRGDI